MNQIKIRRERNQHIINAVNNYIKNDAMCYPHEVMICKHNYPNQEMFKCWNISIYHDSLPCNKCQIFKDIDEGKY